MIFKHLSRIIREHINRVSWLALGLIFVLHSLVTWLLLLVFGELELIKAGNYFYYYIVTTSTVGYGDLSPQTTSGKWVVSIFQIPFGLALFGAVLGKMGQTIGCLLYTSPSPRDA